MASIDDLLNRIAAAKASVDNILTSLADSTRSADELAAQFQLLGAHDKLTQADAVRCALEDQQVQVTAALHKLNEAKAQTEALRGGLGNGVGSGRMVLPATAETPTGWDSAPDLAASRDAMPRLGQVTPGRKIHILDGDGDGISGGHRWDSEIPGKKKFPPETGATSRSSRRSRTLPTLLTNRPPCRTTAVGVSLASEMVWPSVSSWKSTALFAPPTRSLVEAWTRTHDRLEVMEINEFIALATAVVDRLAPKVDPQQAEFVREDADAGAWDNALSNLAASLSKHRVSVTERDKHDLYRLLTDMGESTEEVDRLNVVDR